MGRMRRLLRPLQFVLSAAILVWIYRSVPLEDMLTALGTARIPYVLLGCAFILLLVTIVSRRVGLLAEEVGIRLPLRTLLEIQLAALFYKLFIPGGALASIGVRYYKLRKYGDRSAALSAAVVDRILATMGLGVVGALSWIIDRPPLPSAVGWIIFGWGVAMTLLIIALLGRTTGRLAVRLADATHIESISRRTTAWVNALAAYRSMSVRRRWQLVLLSLAPHLAGICAYASLGAALDVHLSLVTWGWIRAAVTLLTTQPISVAGLGVREVSLVYLLGFYGVPRETCLALASLMLGVLVLFGSLLGGSVEGWRVLLGRRSEAERQRSSEASAPRN